MTPEERLRREIELSQDEGLPVELWWRDDDLIANTPNFDILMELSESIAAPVLMAIIPGLLGDLRLDAASSELVYFCQHGWRHINHEADGAAKSEFGAGRDPDAVAVEIAQGLDRLDKLLGARRFPVFVPPWNAFDACHLGSLVGQGFTGLSSYPARKASFAADGVRLANTHIDVLNWTPGGPPGHRPLAELLNHLATLVASRRTERAADPEPIGLLTHHRAMISETWPVLQELFRTLNAIPGVSWACPTEVFAAPP